MFCVVLKGAWRCGLGMFDFFPAIRNVFFQRVESGLYQILLARSILLFGEVCPIAPIRIGAADDCEPFFACGARFRIVEAKGPRSNIAIEQ